MSPYFPALQQRTCSEHEDNAVAVRRVSGLNRAHRSEPCSHLPHFYCDCSAHEAVSEIDSLHEVIDDWEVKFRQE